MSRDFLVTVQTMKATRYTPSFQWPSMVSLQLRVTTDLSTLIQDCIQQPTKPMMGIHTSTVYCSYPDQVCVYDLSSSAALPQITLSLENRLTNTSFFSASCADQYVRLAGVTQLGPPEGMKYDGIARLTTRTGTAYCSNTTDGTLIIPASSHIRMFSLIIAAGTNYDQKAGDAAHNFSFKGPDAGPTIENTISSAMSKSESDIRSAHVRDYQNLMGSSASVSPTLPTQPASKPPKLFPAILPAVPGIHILNLFFSRLADIYS